jgi:molybdate transport system regulatory protein
MSLAKIDTVLALRRNRKLLLGRDRIKLLEAVAQAGGITRATTTEGFSNKTAWGRRQRDQ